MSIPRYACRTVGFALLYLAATLAGQQTTVPGSGVALFWPAAAVAVVWLLAQARFGRRDLDVIALAVAAAVLPATGHSLLGALAAATAQVVPALLVAWLVDRRLPGYRLGHGDRFRRAGPTAVRLAAIAAAGALAGAVLQYTTAPGELSAPEGGYLVLRDTAAVLLGVLLIRAVGPVSRRPAPAADAPAPPPAAIDAPRPAAAPRRRRRNSRNDRPPRNGLTVVR